MGALEAIVRKSTADCHLFQRHDGHLWYLGEMRPMTLIALCTAFAGCGDDSSPGTDGGVSDSGSTTQDGSSSAALDDLCAALVEWAKACPSEPPGASLDDCQSDLACTVEVSRESVVELATECLARNDCMTYLALCFNANETGYSPSPNYDAFRKRCFERRTECPETFDGQACFAEHVRDDILASMTACLDLPCDQLSDCVYVDSGFRCR